MTTVRRVERIERAQPASDGAGVRLHRSLGSPGVGMFDPFLLLDEFRSDDPNDYLAGFPNHPHRGFETVTYMLAGSMQHKDNKGNTGELGPGSVQWMTAGRGIVHSEMPRQQNGLMWGLQLWVNLPASHKLCEPRYQDIPAAEVPEVTLDDGARVRVIAGRVHGVEGAVQGIAVAPTYLDVSVPSGGRWDELVDSGHSAFAYVIEGSVHIGPTEEAQQAEARHVVLLGDGDRVAVRAGEQGARFLLVAGRPIREPVAWLGPFVMNTREEIVQAVRDFESGRLQQ